MTIMWEPSLDRVEKSQMKKFMTWVNKQKGLELSNYQDLYNWSVENSDVFWSSCFDFFDISYEGDKTLNKQDLKFLDYNWFPFVKLNFAQNLLKKGLDDAVALQSLHESGSIKELTYAELRSQVSKLQNELSSIIKAGDVVAAYMPNISETVVGMLATAALGGVFTSTSSDFGVGGVVDRFGQSKPKVLIAAVRYTYNGKEFSQVEKIQEIKKQVPSIEKIIYVDFLDSELNADTEAELQDGILFSDVMKQQRDTPIEFVMRKFSDPLYIMYSSGTTGKPKCIVHSVGGTLLQHLKELSLHTDLTAEKAILFFTTCGWMMWNWLVSSLALGARVGLYEGSPAAPSLESFVDLVDREKFEIWGTSPKFLRALELSGFNNQNKNYLSHLETILSTGAPLLPEQYDYVYSSIRSDIQLCSISGGTDILGCFMLGNPLEPVVRGEIQCRGLAMAVASLDEKQEAIVGSQGELVCLQSFPSQPIYFLNDNEQERYKSAYFEAYGEAIWHHGDFVTITPSGGVLVHGRSDATLNPGGVRIGTAEIYRQVDLLDFVDDSICVGRSEDGDVSVTLFIKPKDKNFALTDEKLKQIKSTIRKKTTPRHVPKYIKLVDDIPYTRSGKKMELVVARAINGIAITNKEAISNPGCLEQYEKAFS